MRQVLSKDEENAPEGTFPAHLRREEIPIEYKPEGYSDLELEVLSEKVSRYRTENSLPLLDEFRDWLRKTSASAEALTDDLTSKAIHYLLSRWDAAILYISDGPLPMDNGADERKIRPLKLGLKNYLFCASEVGAKAAAVFYSLIHSAKMQGIHPYYYLLDLRKRINEPGLKPSDLIPHLWKDRFFKEAVPEHLHHVLDSS